MHDEGYVLIAKPGSATVIGETASGVFYGVQTLKQLVTGEGPQAMLATGTIRDWPAMKYRGIDDDLSRGPFPTLAFMKEQLRTFAAYKINIYSPYLEDNIVVRRRSQQRRSRAVRSPARSARSLPATPRNTTSPSFPSRSRSATCTRF